MIRNPGLGRTPGTAALPLILSKSGIRRRMAIVIRNFAVLQFVWKVFVRPAKNADSFHQIRSSSSRLFSQYFPDTSWGGRGK